VGRPSILPEQLLRALLVQAFSSIRSERRLMEQAILKAVRAPSATACLGLWSNGTGRFTISSVSCGLF
jgi:hypothetical protein